MRRKKKEEKEEDEKRGEKEAEDKEEEEEDEEVDKYEKMEEWGVAEEKKQEDEKEKEDNADQWKIHRRATLLIHVFMSCLCLANCNDKVDWCWQYHSGWCYRGDFRDVCCDTCSKHHNPLQPREL